MLAFKFFFLSIKDINTKEKNMYLFYPLLLVYVSTKDK